MLDIAEDALGLVKMLFAVLGMRSARRFSPNPGDLTIKCAANWDVINCDLNVLMAIKWPQQSRNRMLGKSAGHPAMGFRWDFFPTKPVHWTPHSWWLRYVKIPFFITPDFWWSHQISLNFWWVNPNFLMTFHHLTNKNGKKKLTNVYMGCKGDRTWLVWATIW